ncbi:MAG: hypothetical protein AAGJ46_19630 [Planctomycetota bacterium]
MPPRKSYLLTGCVTAIAISLLVGLTSAKKDHSPHYAMLAAIILPMSGCYAAGLKSRKTLFKVAAYSALGWWLTWMLQPSIARASTSPRAVVEDYWVVACGCVAGLLAFVAAAFAPLDSSEGRSQRR